VTPLPAAVAAAIEEAVGASGTRHIADVRGIGGGCISPAARLELDDGTRLFAKWGDGSTPPDLFRAEARSLDAMRRTGAVRVPAVVGVGERWLALEWLPSGRPTSKALEGLGRDLAAMHRTTAATYGWEEPNFIGSLPQSNRRTADWPTFWRDERIMPQLRRASSMFAREDRRRFDVWLDRLDDILDGSVEDGPSLLHGDLWNGNVHVGEDGVAALIDPSSYYGHREVDLAMAELFGGFGAEFFAGYEAVWPLRAGYRERRRGAYQLYYLLVHVNLFGGSYVAGSLSALGAAGG
jgi:fructosamine-3-kinase